MLLQIPAVDGNTIADIIVGIAAVATALKWVGDYLSKRKASETQVELRKIEAESDSAQSIQHNYTELVAKYDVLLGKYNESIQMIQQLNINLERAIAAFEILLPLIENEFKDRPAILKIIERVYTNIKSDEDGGK